MKSWVDISGEELPVAEVHRFLAASEGGGITVFVGTTRKLTDGKITSLLSYEAHITMAHKEMTKLVRLAGEQWPILRAVLLHRTGDVLVGEASVIVGVATAHRAASFEACRYLIDELKKTVQIWKKEIDQDGNGEWIGDEWGTD